MHKSLWNLLIPVLISLNAISVVADEEAAGADTPVSHLGFSSTKNVEQDGVQYRLELVGQAERSFLFFDVYNVGYYQEVQDTKQRSIVELLCIIYERDLPKEKVHKALSSGLRKNLGKKDWEVFAGQIQDLIGGIRSDVAEGDVLKILNVGAEKITFIYNGAPMYSFSNPVLSKALMDIWLGEYSVVDRDALINGAP